MSDTSIGLKEKVFDFIVKASNTMSKTSNISTFLSTGKLTPEEVWKCLSFFISFIYYD